MLNNFRFLTAGESHGQCLNGIIDGIPSGIEIDFDFINSELKRRQSGIGRGERMQIESDIIKIKSGVRNGITTGAPICLEIINNDFENWKNIMAVEKHNDFSEEKSFTQPRPGHADFAGSIKYNLKDLRDVLERSSARKTAIDVAIGAIAKIFLKEFDITCEGKVLSIKSQTAQNDISNIIEQAKEKGDTLGAKIEVKFYNLPVGLGSHVQWDRKLDGLIAQAVMSIPAIKAVEIGLGTQSAEVFGSEMQDELFFEDGKYFRKTNNAGGIEGGMTNGETLIVKASMKPIPTMRIPLNTVDLKDNSATKAHFERSDVCAAHACCTIVESMIACVLADAFLEKFGKDNINEIKNNYKK